ncbi:MAG TPA: HAMP domain-containing protein, partial [Dehalococcoidia bacterium]|nr:HAMP domain-containing protein [Dehalococcoidia bacterium]
MDVNAQRGRSIATQLNGLMLVGLLVPVAAVLAIGIFTVRQIGTVAAASTDLSTQLLAVTFIGAVIAVIAAAAAWLRTRSLVRTHTLELADICRQVASGDRTVRAPVVGEDEFAVLAAAVNAVLDGAPAATGAASLEGQDAATLQAQIEKLLQEVSAVG